MNSASTLRPAQNNSADSEIYIQDYMQSICSLYIHRKMASIYPGQRLFSLFYWVGHPWKQIAQIAKTRAPEQTTRANHQSTRAPETDSEQTTRAPEHQRTRAPEEEEEEEEEEEVYRRRSAPRRCACRPPANCRSEIHAPGLQPGRLRAFYQQQQQRQCQNAISMYITYCSYIIHIAIFYTCG